MASSQSTREARFPLGQHVEVLQINQALRGSWQIATIVMVKDGRREVQYNEIFQSDGVQKVRVSFSVTKDSEIANNNSAIEKIRKRGFLRPLAPKVTISVWTKGLLVDVFIKGAWWEGVMMEDTQNAQVKVLFPDRKEESLVYRKHLRVSHQWDEFTGEWEARGYWKGFCVSDGKATSYQEVKDANVYTPQKHTTCNNQLSQPDAGVYTCQKEQKELIQAKMSAARQFLFDIGYTVEFHQRMGRAREAVYIAPHGRRFYSLTKACKNLKKECSLPCNIEACKSKTDRLSCIYDFPSSFCGELAERYREGLKAVVSHDNGEAIDVYKTDPKLLCIETHCVQDSQAIQIVEPNCVVSEHKRRPKRHKIETHGVQESQAIQIVSIEREHKCGGKRHLTTRASLSSVHSVSTNGTIIERTAGSQSLISTGSHLRSKKQNLSKVAFSLMSKQPFSKQGFLQNSQGMQSPGPFHNKDEYRFGQKHGHNAIGEISSLNNRATTSTTNRKTSKGRVGCKALILREAQSQTILRREETDQLKVAFLPLLCTPLNKQGEKVSFNHDSFSPASASSSVVTEVSQHAEQDEKADEICSACGDGGDLVLCDYCPSTYHAQCVGLEVIPEGNWYCFSCCCASCEEFLFEREDGSLPLSCKQCEKKYHVNCSPPESRCNSSSNNWFCGVSCEQLHIGLCRQVGISFPLETGGLSWMLLKSNEQKDCLRIENKLSLAHVVLQECFVPIIDVCTRLDIISQTLFSKGSAMTRLNCMGFYTLILERGCELISVATFRIHGSRLAEMPFIGTQFQHRRKGMCRRLMGVLEKMLYKMGVKKLLLPAVPQLLKTWKQKFDFQHINSWDRFEMRQMNLMRFPGTVILKKNLIRLPSESHGCFPLITQAVNSSGISLGCREDSGRCKMSRLKTHMQNLDVEDIKVVVATTKYKRLKFTPPGAVGECMYKFVLRVSHALRRIKRQLRNFMEIECFAYSMALESIGIHSERS
ncbi:hypothetical protein L7F22_007697 [Adiantum nelumboides]|nr:hypothetical protein [Adiantum nelumboides]